MKRLLLVAGFCIAVSVVVPVTAASAEELNGKCTVTGGKANFFKKGGETVNANLNETPQELAYNFKEGVVTCVEAGTGAVSTGTVEVTKGEGKNLACLGGLQEEAENGKVKVPVTGESTVDGKGTLKVKAVVGGGEKTVGFDLAFTSNVGVVALETFKEGGETLQATGAAEFFTSETPKAFECKAGVHTLEFKAETAGKLG